MGSGLRVFLVACLSFSIVSCAQTKEFGKIGVSKKFVKRDSDKCWKNAQSPATTATHAAVGGATTVAIGLLTASPGVIVGGLIGQGISAADPKSGDKRALHDACMKKKGYKAR